MRRDKKYKIICQSQSNLLNNPQPEPMCVFMCLTEYYNNLVSCSLYMKFKPISRSRVTF